MADQPKKPRNIKDLKARLGRTIQPGGGGAGPVPPPAVGGPVPPPAAPGGGLVPPPSVGGGPTPGAGVVPPPAVAPAPLPIPGAGVAPPPFIQQQQQAQQQAAAAEAQRKRAADPFGSAVERAPAAHEVRLVIDDKPVDDAEVGRKQRSRNYLLIAAGLVLGLLLGLGMGSVNAERNLYNSAVEDGQAIYQQVRTASDTVNKAKTYIEGAVKKARGGGGQPPAVDYQAIEKLVALEKPFDAGVFNRRKYGAFQPGTVDALFEYYTNVQTLWTQFEGLGATTAGDERRQTLDEACQAVGEMASSQTGCVPMTIEGQYFCGLVYAHAPEEQPPAGEPVKLQVSTTLTGRRFEKTLYTGGDLAEETDSFVILTHTQRSVGVLGERASACAVYQRDLLQIKTLMDRTAEVQGRLESELGNVARLETVLAF